MFTFSEELQYHVHTAHTTPHLLPISLSTGTGELSVNKWEKLIIWESNSRNVTLLVTWKSNLITYIALLVMRQHCRSFSCRSKPVWHFLLWNTKEDTWRKKKKKKNVFWRSKLFGYQHSSKYLLLCFTEEKNACRFGILWVFPLDELFLLFIGWQLRRSCALVIAA